MQFGGWIISLRGLAVWGLKNVLKFFIFIFIEIFGKLNNFQHFDTFINSIKTLNFSRQSGLQGCKIVAKFLLRSPFLLVYKNTTMKRQISHETIQKNVTCIMAFFISFHSTCVTLCQVYSITSPVFFTKSNKLRNERK